MSRWMQVLIATILGLAAGLVYGWNIAPVEYVDTTPDTLRADYRADYVLMVAEVYQTEQNLDLAARRLAILGSEHPSEIAAQALEFAQASAYTESDLNLLQNLSQDLQAWQPVQAGDVQ
ncbi:MAG: hypothetical protein GXP40_01490 [Chloroflexi bacterium]|nr:hypothetical protein [Chloroflexota bacterium]